jgi:hypothetical protein
MINPLSGLKLGKRIFLLFDYRGIGIIDIYNTIK